MLRIPKERDKLELWLREVIDECHKSSQDRDMIYTNAAQYYYSGNIGSLAAIYNKIKPMVERMTGMIYSPTDLRFSIVYDSSQDDKVLEMAEFVSEKLTADFRETDSDVQFGDAVKWSLINGCSIIKVTAQEPPAISFRCSSVHPTNFGVLSEFVQNIEDQDAVLHVSYPTVGAIYGKLVRQRHPRTDQIMDEVLASLNRDGQDNRPAFHQLIVGGLNPVGGLDQKSAQAAGVVNVFPMAVPWRPQLQYAETVKLCELWVKDADRLDEYGNAEWTTFQVVYPDVILVGDEPWEENRGRTNLSGVPGRCPFIKIAPIVTPGYFWGRSVVADVQMLQDILSTRLEDIKVMWDRNARAPYALSGYTSVTTDIFDKLLSRGGFINDPNPNASAKKLEEAPPPNYLEELQYIDGLFDDVAGFTPVSTGQGESGVRSGVHAQTLVRTSSPRLVQLATSIERSASSAAELCVETMKHVDPTIYKTDDQGISMMLRNLPDDFQVVVDSHSGSPIFAEDAVQKAVVALKAGAIDQEDFLHILNLPGNPLMLSKLKKRQKAQAKQAQEEKQEGLIRDVLGLPEHKRPQQAAGGRRR